MPIIGMKDIVDGQISDGPRTLVVASESEIANCLLRQGDLLLNRTNSPDLVGKMAVWSRDEAAVFASYLVRYPARPEKAHPRFTLAALSTSRSKQQIDRLVTRAISQANINPSAFYDEVEIAVPPLPEQERIVAVLDAWDQAIRHAKRLLEVKRRRFGGVMKQIIWNGSDDWRPLSELMTISRDRVGSERSLEVYSVTREGLTPQIEQFSKRIANSDISRHMILRPGEFALSGLNFWLGSVDVSSEKVDVCISPDYKVYRFKDCAHPQYFKYLVRSDAFREILVSCAVERASVVRKNFNRELFFESEVPVPSFSEQKCRSAILSAMSEEIAETAATIGALVKQKRGLMQKLLVGEWRLDRQFDLAATQRAVQVGALA